MQRDEFSFYLYDLQFELVEHSIGYQQLITAIENKFKYMDRRSNVQQAISDNDKALIVDGQYVQYLRRIFNRSPHKPLVLTFLDAEDDRFDQYLKQIDLLQQKFTEVYIVLLIKQVYSETYVQYLEQHPILNKFNIVSNEYDLVENAIPPGKTMQIQIEDQKFVELAKF